MACACQRGPAATPATERTPTPLDTATTGTITGHVRFNGSAPAQRPVPELARDPACVTAHPDGLATGGVRGEAGMLADALVYVADGLEDRVFAIPEAPLVIDQRGCLFVPPIAGVRAGQRIEFVNSDDTLHNVHGAPSASAAWNFGLGVQGARRSIVIERPEVPLPVRCEVHPWMRADIGVFAHPYFAVTAADGAFTLPLLPAGHYVLGTWHTLLGRREQAVDVAPGGTTVADVRFTAD